MNIKIIMWQKICPVETIKTSDFAVVQSLQSWIISLANAKALFKIDFAHKFFYLLTDFENICCTFYDKFSARYC